MSGKTLIITKDKVKQTKQIIEKRRKNSAYLLRLAFFEEKKRQNIIKDNNANFSKYPNYSVWDIPKGIMY